MRCRRKCSKRSATGCATRKHAPRRNKRSKPTGKGSRPPSGPAATGSWPAYTKPSGAKRASAAGASGERSRRQRRSYCWPWASITSPHRATCAAGYRPTSSPRPTTKASTYYPTAPASGSTPAACCAITVIFRAASAWSSSPAKHSSKSAATKNARSSSKPTT